MKNALVLSGGGFKGAFQLGAIKELLEKGIEFSAVSGVSVGALNASQVAQNNISGLEKLWEDVIATNGKSITKGNIAELSNGSLSPVEDKVWEVALKGISKLDITAAILNKKKRLKLINQAITNINSVNNLLDNSPLEELLLTNVKLDNFIMPFFFGLVSLYTGKLYELSEKDFKLDRDIAKAVLASSTMPVVWKPIPLVNTKYGPILNAVDGGLRMVNPLSQIWNYIQDDEHEWTIWVINCNNAEMSYREASPTLSQIAGTSIDILLNEVLHNDVELSSKMNEWADSIGKKKAILRTIEPGGDGLGKTMDASSEVIKWRIQLGKKLVNKYF